jgi:glycosyltransferase involved in cell wall biosynthesis
MRILYDGEIYNNQSAGGINRYFANLINRLPQGYSPTLTVFKFQDTNFPSHSNLNIVRLKPFKGYSFRLFYALNNYDLIHPTYYTLLTQQDASHCRFPIVLTVYDLIHELFYPDDPIVEAKRRAILSAQAIICISHNTKRDLLERFSIPEDKVSVTYLASEIDVSSSYGNEKVPQYPYYLYVGSRASYKNFDGLLSAFTKVASVDPYVRLCVVGSAFRESEQAIINESRLQHRIEHYGNVDNNHLSKLYRCSVAFIYPSLYEGFGIPPLEAMSCGTVAIVANSSSLPEVVGDASLLFAPKATSDLADIMLLLLNNPSKRDALIEKGYQRAKLFSWDKTVTETVEVYRTLQP